MAKAGEWQVGNPGASGGSVAGSTTNIPLTTIHTGLAQTQSGWKPQVVRPVNIENQPQTPWVFKTLSMGGWDYEGNPILVVVTLETVKDEVTGKLQGSNVLFDFVDPKNPSKRVAVMTDSLLEVLDEIKGAYTLERLASEGKR
jgi:hypothetical protein